MVEERIEERSGSRGTRKITVEPFSLFDGQGMGTERIETGIKEFDRVVGGGLVPDSTVLLGGDPGIGKSTLMLQIVDRLGQYQPLYVTAEESLEQIRTRAQRLAIKNSNITVLPDNSVENVLEQIRKGHHRVVVIDSIQTMETEHIESAPGSVAQVRESAALLSRVAKEEGVVILFVGHITKEGALAGPKVLEHIVDTVIQFEGEQFYAYRVLRALKNRYGATNELGFFEMTSKGLEEVPNPSELFLSSHTGDEPGSVLTIAVEGSRVLALEVQSLVSTSSYPVPQRSSMGYDLRRLNMLLAVIEKRFGLPLGKYDVFVNIAGGLRVSDPGIDLAVAAAIVASYRDIALPHHIAVVGEVGLTGEIRTVYLLNQRIREAERLGLRILYGPSAGKYEEKQKISYIPLTRLVSGLTEIFRSRDRDIK